jgi:hypothetical protein
LIKILLKKSGLRIKIGMYFAKRNTQMTNGKRITIRMHQIINKKTGIY